MSWTQTRVFTAAEWSVSNFAYNYKTKYIQVKVNVADSGLWLKLKLQISGSRCNQNNKHVGLSWNKLSDAIYTADQEMRVHNLMKISSRQILKIDTITMFFIKSVSKQGNCLWNIGVTQ